MTSQSSGGSGSGLPGVTGDGLTPGGLDVAGQESVTGALTSASLSTGSAVVAGALAAGDSTAATEPTFHHVWGMVTFFDTPGNVADGDDNVDIKQRTALTQDTGGNALWVKREGALNGFQYTAPVFQLDDVTATTAPVFQVNKQGVAVLELTTQKSITGALASVTDANAKAVLTSIIAALTGIKVAADNTT